MFCEKCGTRLAEDSLFCTACGSAIGTAGDESRVIDVNDSHSRGACVQSTEAAAIVATQVPDPVSTTTINKTLTDDKVVDTREATNRVYFTGGLLGRVFKAGVKARTLQILSVAGGILYIILFFSPWVMVTGQDWLASLGIGSKAGLNPLGLVELGVGILKVVDALGVLESSNVAVAVLAYFVIVGWAFRSLWKTVENTLSILISPESTRIGGTSMGPILFMGGFYYLLYVYESAVAQSGAFAWLVSLAGVSFEQLLAITGTPIGLSILGYVNKIFGSGYAEIAKEAARTPVSLTDRLAEMACPQCEQHSMAIAKDANGVETLAKCGACGHTLPLNDTKDLVEVAKTLGKSVLIAAIVYMIIKIGFIKSALVISALLLIVPMAIVFLVPPEPGTEHEDRGVVLNYAIKVRGKILELIQKLRR